MMKKYYGIVWLIAGISCCSAFSPISFSSVWKSKHAFVREMSLDGEARKSKNNLNRLYMADNGESNNSQKKKSSLDENVRNRLLTESVAPWRTLRLFLYFSCGSGALLGGLITLSGTIAAVSAGSSDVDLNTEYLNLAIDFGAVAAFGLLVKFDLDKQAELEEGIQEKIAKKKEQQALAKGMREREKMLGALSLSLQVGIGNDGQTVEANVKELQAAAKQHMILVAGPKKACKDALIGANLLKMDFAMSNVLVVPYETDVDEAERQSKPSGTGFGSDTAGPALYEKQPYVARPVGEGWDEYMAGEIADAVAQNGAKAESEGIAIVIANNGKVLRRGVGKVPWRQMVEELNSAVTA